MIQTTFIFMTIFIGFTLFLTMFQSILSDIK